ncbi:MAG: ABC transporter ATP-binding protein [Candidatus Sumerlaeota bacterium]|nr:ABC transporter ATP-binding protein [Candidatus Sumerlaeota bacterium]
MPVIETFGLTKTYVRDFIDVEHGRVRFSFWNRKVSALRNLTLSVEAGEIFGLLGPNGAGKSTALKILMGIIFPTAGDARLMGRPLGDRSVKARIGFLPENPYFYDYLTGREFLNYYGALYGMPRAARKKKTEELLELVGLADAARLPLKGYSKGMNQRIGLAQALLADPDLVFLDEPQSGLDPLGRKEIRDIILRLREQGKTVFFSSHILSDAEMICDRVAILVKGELKNIGKLSELLSRRVKEYEVAVAGASKETVESFRDKALRVLENPGETMFLVEKEELALEIVRKVMDGGGRLIAFTPRRETLEEYFITQVAGAAASVGAQL